MESTPNDLMGIGLMMLSLSAPITAAIVRYWRPKTSQPAAASPHTNGSKVDIREFMEFREEVREGFRDVKGEMGTLRVLIQERL